MQCTGEKPAAGRKVAMTQFEARSNFHETKQMAYVLYSPKQSEQRPVNCMKRSSSIGAVELARA